MRKKLRLKVKIKKWPKSDRFWSILVFLGSFIGYLVTLPTTTTFEDSAEFVTAAVTLGIPHPSGYPLYVLLAHPFSWLPFGTYPWKIALFSAVVATLSLVFAHDLARRLIRRMGMKLNTLAQLALVAIVLAVGYSSIWWGQAIQAEVYTLHALLITATIWGIVMAAEKSKCRWLILACFAYGLSLANHLTLALVHAPFLLVAAVFARPKFFHFSHWRLWLAGLGALVVGLLPYLWMWFRSISDPPYIMGSIGSFSDFIGYIFRRDYSDLGVSAWNKVALFAEVFWQPIANIGFLAVIGTVIGLWRLSISRNRTSLAILIGAVGAIFAAPLALLIRKTDFTQESVYMSRVYGLAGFPLLAVIASVGVVWLLLRLKADRKKRLGLFLVGLALILWPLCRLAVSSQDVAAFRHPFSYDYGKAMLASLPERSVLLVNDGVFTHDSEIFTLLYLQTVEKFRTDVTVIQDSGINTMKQPIIDGQYYNQKTPHNERRRLMMHMILGDQRFIRRPIFSTYPAEQVNEVLRSMSNGVVFAVSRPMVHPPESLPVPEVRLPDDEIISNQPALAQQASHFYYVRAAWLFDQFGSKAASQELLKAMKLDSIPFSEDYQGFVLYRDARMRSD